MKYFQIVAFLLITLTGFSQGSLFSVEVMNYSNFNEVKKLEKFELGVELPQHILAQVNNFTKKRPGDKINPYLDWEIKVVAEFIHPSYKAIQVDGFYTKEYTTYQNYAGILPTPRNGIAYSDIEYQSLSGYKEKVNHYPFRVRFSPPATGEWECKVSIILPSQILLSSTFRFKVISSSNKGYIKVGQNKRYLTLDNESFYPVGMNTPWPQTVPEFDPELSNYLRGWDSKKNGWGTPVSEAYKPNLCDTRVYDKYRELLTSLSDNGANMFRMIMAPQANEIEWETLGDYTKRLSIAQEMDEILETAEKEDFYLLWNMQVHYSFQPSHQAYYVYWAWDSKHPNGDEFCYKKMIGENPIDFFTSEEAKKYYKQRLRYIVARWGYSTHVGIFEIFGEINQATDPGSETGSFYKTESNYKVFAEWHKEMGSYIKSHHNGSTHILTTGYAGYKNNSDDTFVGEPFDVSSKDEYDIDAPSFGSFINNQETATGYFNESNNSNCKVDSYIYTSSVSNNQPYILRNVKPLIYSETGFFHELNESCDYNKIELDRQQWQSLFSGVALSFPWSGWYRDLNTIESFGQTSSFINQFQLDMGNWHPGYVKTKNPEFGKFEDKDYDPTLKDWEYKGEYTKRMEGKNKQSDLCYLRSGDRNYVIGVITNRTYNIYSVEDCFDKTWEENNSNFGWNYDLSLISTPLAIDCKDEKLMLKNLKWDKYFINYFTPKDLSNPVHSSSDRGPNVKIEYVFTGNESDYITIIMARKKNTSWIPTTADSIALAEVLEENFNDTTGFDISIFQPKEEFVQLNSVQSDSMVHLVSNEYTNLKVVILNIEGEQQDTFIMKSKEHSFDISNYEEGLYYLNFYLGEDLIETKKMVR